MSKLSNFKYIGTSNKEATVDVTTGYLWWKTTEKREIYRICSVGPWRWLEGGDPIEPAAEISFLEVKGLIDTFDID
jgi:hypothetical protein